MKLTYEKKSDSDKYLIFNHEKQIIGQVAFDRRYWRFFPTVGTLLEASFTAYALKDIMIILQQIKNGTSVEEQNINIPKTAESQDIFSMILELAKKVHYFSQRDIREYIIDYGYDIYRRVDALGRFNALVPVEEMRFSYFLGTLKEEGKVCKRSKKTWESLIYQE